MVKTSPAVCVFLNGIKFFGADKMAAAFIDHLTRKGYIFLSGSPIAIVTPLSNQTGKMERFD